jgi:hypothetical protein
MAARWHASQWNVLVLLWAQVEDLARHGMADEVLVILVRLDVAMRAYADLRRRARAIVPAWFCARRPRRPPEPRRG